MSRRTLWLVVGLLIFGVVLISTTASALSWEEEHTFSKNPVRQDEMVDIEVEFTNTNDNQMRLECFGIHFDWQREDYYYMFYDDADNPIALASGGSTSFDITVEIERDIVETGYHSYYFYGEYEIQDGWFDTWNWYSGQTDPVEDLRVLERDRDGDGYGDSEDAFPDDSDEWVDTDLDGVGDNGDAFPNDPLEQLDSDDDGVGDNADAFPNDPDETTDSDNDGVGDNGDAFPNDPEETKDSDSDGVGDNSDVFPNDAAETKDTDSDGVGDNADAFPQDGSASLDSDGDGYPDEWNTGKTKDDSTTGLKIDKYPQNANKWKEEEDSPSVGVFAVIISLMVGGIIVHSRR